MNKQTRFMNIYYRFIHNLKAIIKYFCSPNIQPSAYACNTVASWRAGNSSQTFAVKQGINVDEGQRFVIHLKHFASHGGINWVNEFSALVSRNNSLWVAGRILLYLSQLQHGLALQWCVFSLVLVGRVCL